MAPAKRKTPTERAKEHAEKVKEMQARREQKSSPGPGAYRAGSYEPNSGASESIAKSVERWTGLQSASMTSESVRPISADLW